MTEKFIFTNETGELFIKEILVQYDFPIVFICNNILNDLYLFYKYEESTDSDSWIVVKIKEDDVLDLKANRKDLLSMYKKHIKNQMFYIDYNFKTDISDCKQSEIIKKEVFNDEKVFLMEYNMNIKEHNETKIVKLLETIYRTKDMNKFKKVFIKYLTENGLIEKSCYEFIDSKSNAFAVNSLKDSDNKTINEITIFWNIEKVSYSASFRTIPYCHLTVSHNNSRIYCTDMPGYQKIEDLIGLENFVNFNKKLINVLEKEYSKELHTEK